MITALQKPHLVAVHIDHTKPEFPCVARLWGERDRFATRTCVTVGGRYAYPFEDADPRTQRTPVTATATWLHDFQVVGEQTGYQIQDGPTFEINSPRDSLPTNLPLEVNIVAAAIPPQVDRLDFVLMGGYLDDDKCLPTAFMSLFKLHTATLGYRYATFRIPLDCTYAPRGLDKIQHVRLDNDFLRELAWRYRERYAVTLDGQLLSGSEDAIASLHWFSTMEKMFDAMQPQID